MLRLLLLICLVIPLASSAQIRVLTYNIRNSHAKDGVNNWNKRKATLAALIKKIDPDILGTQEVLPDQLKYLNSTLAGYVSFGAGRNDGKHAGEHSAVFFRSSKYEQTGGGNFWLSQTPGVPGSKSWDAAITRICTWVKLKDKETGKELLVFNTHFDHRGKLARRNSAVLLRTFVDSLAGNLPVIVTGDFNFGPDDAAYTIMSRVGVDKVQLSDSYTQGALPYTDCGFEVSNTNCHRIDYIWYSPHFSKSNYVVHTDNNGTYYPSDHLPVSVLLKVE